jgi:Uma2 family endonuclease
MLTMTRETDAPPVVSLLDAFDALDAVAPEGYRAELLNGAITVNPPPDGNHEDAIARLLNQIIRGSAVEIHAAGHKGLSVPPAGQDTSGRVIPDITLAPAELNLFRGAPPWMPAKGVAMVVEVTSSDPDRDRNAKRRAYASAKIPLYLLIDRDERMVTLFRDPRGRDYSDKFVVSLGGKLEIPAPFSFTLDTSDFAS